MAAEFFKDTQNQSRTCAGAGIKKYSLKHFRWQTILTRVSPPFQTTKHMKHGRSCDTEI